MNRKRVNGSFFFVCLIYQSDLRIDDTVNETSSVVSAQRVFPTEETGGDFILL